MAKTRTPVQELEKPDAGKFNVSMLSEDEKKDFEFAQKRVIDLQQSRTNHYGIDLDSLWADADRDTIPHRLKTRGKRVIATDEDKGWRGSFVNLGSGQWQSDVSQSNPFVKIQIALSILIDQNPSGVFTPGSKKYEATNEVMRQLYQRSWEIAKSKNQLKLFVYNLAKYGWAAARTYPLYLCNPSKVLTQYDPANPEQSTYEEKDVVEYNDVYRENLDVRNVWIDDMAKPSNPLSLRDWTWRKVYDMDEAEKEFGKSKYWKYVLPGGNTDEVLNIRKVDSKGGQKTVSKNQKLVEALFYENKTRDSFIVTLGGVPVVIEPLPIAGRNGAKKLSLWQTYWNLRHSESPYGVGIYEAIRYDQAMLDRIRNMTIDQLTLSIYKMFFFQGTQSLTETGDIKIEPGVGKQVLDPKNITFLNVPGPGADAYQGIEMFRKDVDEGSGITDPLLGAVTGKTAFEIAQAKEAALKRLKNPLDNITEALNDEGYITIALIQLLYSIPEVYEIADPQLINNYLQEIQSDPNLYERTPHEDPTQPDVFKAKVYREFPMNLEKDEKGNLTSGNETQFFRTKPGSLDWDGIIAIKSQSLLTPSKQLDKTLTLEMYNMLIPLLVQPPQIYNKVAKDIVKQYDRDPQDILPDLWLQDQFPPPEQPMFVDAGQGQPPTDQPAPAAPTLTASPSQPSQPTSLVGKIMSRLRGPAA